MRAAAGPPLPRNDDIVALTDEGDDADEQVHASSPSPPYEGETVDGLSHGQGVMTFQDGKWKGCVYRGHFERGAMSD